MDTTAAFEIAGCRVTLALTTEACRLQNLAVLVEGLKATSELVEVVRSAIGQHLTVRSRPTVADYGTDSTQLIAVTLDPPAYHRGERLFPADDTGIHDMAAVLQEYLEDLQNAQGSAGLLRALRPYRLPLDRSASVTVGDCTITLSTARVGWSLRRAVLVEGLQLAGLSKAFHVAMGDQVATEHFPICGTPAGFYVVPRFALDTAAASLCDDVRLDDVVKVVLRLAEEYPDNLIRPNR